MKMFDATVSRVRCMQTMRLLQSYLDGNLDELEARRVAAHLEDCRRCGLEISVYREIKGALRRHEPSVETVTLQRLRHFSRHLAEGDDAAAGDRGA